MRLAFAILSSALFGCAAPPPPVRTGPPPPSACIGGLCVRPDHAIARPLGRFGDRRCLIVAWDGESNLPPTARVGVVDDTAAARPGIFLAVELPNLRSGVTYRLANTDARPGRGAPTAMSARVDPAVRFADQRIAERGEVVVIPTGGDMIVRVETTWPTGAHETATIVVPRAQNACGAPIEL